MFKVLYPSVVPGLGAAERSRRCAVRVFLGFGFCGGGRVWICWAVLVSLGSLGSNCLQFGLLNSELRARCSGTSGSGQGFRQTLVWMGPGGRAPVSDVPEEREER